MKVLSPILAELIEQSREQTDRRRRMLPIPELNATRCTGAIVGSEWARWPVFGIQSWSVWLPRPAAMS